VLASSNEDAATKHGEGFLWLTVVGDYFSALSFPSALVSPHFTGSKSSP
jgi:hypothetical protein